MSGEPGLSIELVEFSHTLIGELVAAQEKEIMARYGVDDPGPSPMPDTPSLLAHVDGRPVGCVSVAPLDQGVGEIKRMYVTPDARGNSLGRRLLADAERLAVELGYHRLRLETGTMQPEAVGLYTSAGWSRIPCYGHFKDDPTTICMEKALGE